VFDLRIRKVQCALWDGQLDEAYRLVQDDKVREHRKGQRLMLDLAQALAQRGRDHLANGRTPQALDDCNKAEKIGGNLPEVASLRSEICKTVEQKQLDHQKHAQVFEQARQQIDKGWLSAGVDILGDEDNDQATMLRDQAAGERMRIESAVQKVEQSLKRNDLHAAVLVLAETRLGRSRNEQALEAVAKVRNLLSGQIREQLTAGRIDLAGTIEQDLHRIDTESGEAKELKDILDQCRRAASAVATGQVIKAQQILGRLRLILPGAKWVQDASGQIQQCGQAIQALAAGPLGLSMGDQAVAGQPVVVNAADEIEPTAEEASPSPEEKPTKKADVSLPDKFVLQIDGVGGYLVMRGNPVSIGAISSSFRPDIALLCEAQVPTVKINRQEHDYFLRSDKPVQVGDKPVTEAPLTDGERIALSMRCRMKFSMPNAASNTAVLTLSSARLPRPDINQIILMDRDILVGPASSCHIRQTVSNQTVTFYLRNGLLFCKSDEPIEIGGRISDGRSPLPMETTIRAGAMTVVLARYPK
jgi:tetratricopeptide (TPR) repeat protein